MACPPALLNANDEISEYDYILNQSLDFADESLDFKEIAKQKRAESFRADELANGELERLIAGSDVLLSSAAPSSPSCMSNFLDVVDSFKVVENYCGGELNATKLLDSLHSDASQPVLRTLDSTTPEGSDSSGETTRYFTEPSTPTKDIPIPKFVSPPRVYHKARPKIPGKCQKRAKRKCREALQKVRKRLVLEKEDGNWKVNESKAEDGKVDDCKAEDENVFELDLADYTIKGKLQLNLNEVGEDGVVGYAFINILQFDVFVKSAEGGVRWFPLDCENDTEIILKCFLPAAM